MQVLINGKVSGFFERSNPRNLPLPNIFTDIGPNDEVGQRLPEAVSHMCGVQDSVCKLALCIPLAYKVSLRSSVNPWTDNRLSLPRFQTGDIGHLGGGTWKGEFWMCLGLQGADIARHQAQW